MKAHCETILTSAQSAQEPSKPVSNTHAGAAGGGASGGTTTAGGGDGGGGDGAGGGGDGGGSLVGHSWTPVKAMYEPAGIVLVGSSRIELMSVVATVSVLEMASEVAATGTTNWPQAVG